MKRLCVLLTLLVWLILSDKCYGWYFYTPWDGKRVRSNRPMIMLNFGKKGVRKNTIKVKVNGEDVTFRSFKTSSFVSYTPPFPLPTGRNTVEITFEDKKGKLRCVKWHFFVIRENIIKEIKHNGKTSLFPNQVLKVSVVGNPHCVGYFTIGNIAKRVPLEEIKKGIYEGQYKVRLGEYGKNIPLWVTLEDRNGNIATIKAKDGVNIDAKFFKTILLKPKDGDRVGNSFIVEGRTTPNTPVRIYGKLFLDMGSFDFEGPKSSALGKPISTDIVSDENGYFKRQIFVPTPGIPLRANITAWALGEGDVRSLPYTVTVYILGKRK